MVGACEFVPGVVGEVVVVVVAHDADDAGFAGVLEGVAEDFEVVFSAVVGYACGEACYEISAGTSECDESLAIVADGVEDFLAHGGWGVAGCVLWQ